MRCKWNEDTDGMKTLKRNIRSWMVFFSVAFILCRSSIKLSDCPPVCCITLNLSACFSLTWWCFCIFNNTSFEDHARNEWKLSLQLNLQQKKIRRWRKRRRRRTLVTLLENNYLTISREKNNNWRHFSAQTVALKVLCNSRVARDALALCM